LMEAGMTYTIPFYATDWEVISGFQFGMSLNQEKAELLDIDLNEFSAEIGMRKDNFGLSKLKDGILTASWINRDNKNIEETRNLFSIKIKCKQASRLSEILNLNATSLETASYLKDDTGAFVSATFDLEFYLSEEESETEKELDLLKVYQNYPNPISDYTKVRIDAPENICLDFALFDSYGQKLWNQSRCLEKGTQEITLSRMEFGETVGMYYLEISDGRGWKKTIKMIVAK